MVCGASLACTNHFLDIDLWTQHLKRCNMRLVALPLSATLILVLGLGIATAKPDKDGKEKPKEPPAFKPVQINNILSDADGKDPKLQKPAKKYGVHLTKDKTY